MSHTNRLIHEKSPYLLQHAHNPVDWYPWGDEAFAHAATQDKPVFLSIGYSTCHWCHVMERESFEDEETAALLNAAFVCVKVDREERPDLDSVYMTVCQAVTGSGGWPLTIIMTPDKRPFYAATYLPKQSRFGQTGLLELVPRISEYWQTRRDNAEELAGKIVEALQQATPEAGDDTLDEGVLQEAYQQLAARYDARQGGFGRAPKFPMPHSLSLLLRLWRRLDEPHALAMVEHTLQAIRAGGVYDQVGLGLHRYSTDARWLVPHFEKMLYDQALLSLAAIETFQATADDRYAWIARDTISYVLRDLTSSEGGFYSAEDADSEGVEGKFYVWTASEIREALPPDLAALAMTNWWVTEDGNYRDEATNEATGANILHSRGELREGERERLEQAREGLLQVRSQRARPGLDDKVLTDWNGLMIAALARAGWALDAPEYLAAARQATEFIFSRMLTSGGKLLHRYRDGEAGLPAYLDDYAFLTWGLLELYGATFESQYLRRAVELTERVLGDFWDADGGGCFFSSADHEQLFIRQKEIYDGAVPSGNSVMLLNLLRLSRLTGKTRYETHAAALERAFASDVQQSPSAHTQLLCAVDFALGPTQELLLLGGQTGLAGLLEPLRRRFLPHAVVLANREGEDLTALAPFTAQYQPLDGQATAYVCTNQSCSAPVTTVAALLDLLAEA